jgi:hypothetical protein
LTIAGLVAAAEAEYRGARRIGPVRHFVVFVVALALTLQAYIAQTHFHDALRSFSGTAGIADARSPAQSGTPSDHRSADCPLCQAVIHGGVFIAPATLLLNLPFLWVETFMPAFAAPDASIASAHDWQSRAPPRL